MTDKLTGRCSCGAVHYELSSAPMFTHCCHCTDCQRETGSAFAVNALIETDRIKISGPDPVPTRLPTASGSPHDVYRCPNCLTALWSDYGERPYLRFVRVGTLDNSSQVRPDVHIFVRSKLDWVVLPEGARRFDEFYDLRTEWPASALERRAAASANSKKV